MTEGQKTELATALRALSPSDFAELLLTRVANWREHTVRQAVGHLLAAARDGRRSRAEAVGWREAQLVASEVGDIVRR